jgi:hypothetical protein
MPDNLDRMQPEFFDDPPAQRHSPTSLEAAESIRPITGALRIRVLEFLRQCGELGATDEEILQALGQEMGANTLRPRRIELVRMGAVLDSGRTRKTASGRKAVVWIAR